MSISYSDSYILYMTSSRESCPKPKISKFVYQINHSKQLHPAKDSQKISTLLRW